MHATLTTLFPASSMSESETRSLGARTAESLTAGNVLALYGRPGAGKTQFTKGVCRALGIDEERVSSPTFTIVHEYSGTIPVYHVDLYRINDPAEVAALGLEEYLEAGGICIIEWPELLDHMLPPDALRLVFLHEGGNVRRIALADRGVTTGA